MDLPFCDAALSGLTTSPGQLEPEFETHQMDYSATVDQSQVAIFPVNDQGATFEYYVGSSRTPATDADPSAPGFQVDLGCGETTVRIKVIAADGEADESYTVAFTREGGGDIVAPTIRSVSNGAESLTVYWNAPETSCPGDIDHYNLRYSLDQDDVDWTEVQRPSGSLSHTISGLTAGTTYRVQAQAVVAGVAGPWSESATGTPRRSSITQRPQPSQPGLSADYTVNEGDGSVGIAVAISESPQQPTEFRLSTGDVDAVAGRDYTHLVTLVTFLPDSPLTQTVPITILDDPRVEGTETFQVHIVPILGSPLPPGIEAGRYATVAILDDDHLEVAWVNVFDGIRISENREVVLGLEIALPMVTCPHDGNVHVDLSYSDPFSVLTSTYPVPSSITFDTCGRRRTFPLEVGSVSENTEMTFTITDVRSDDVDLNSRMLPGDPRTVTVTVLDVF